MEETTVFPGPDWMLPSAPRIVEERAVVLSNAAVNSEYRHLRVACDKSLLSARAGQFFHILCPPKEGNSPFLRRPMSLYRVDRPQGAVEFLYKVTGLGTGTLATLQAGDALNLVGPLGRGFRIESTWKSIVLVGRGVGLATLAPLAEECSSAGIRVTAILSARRSDLLMSAERLQATGATVIQVTDEDSSSSPENLEAVLSGLFAAHLPDALFTCGSQRLIKLLQRMGRLWKVQGQVALEEQMACGLGMCFCCVKPFCKSDGTIVQHRVCTEGPVFNLDEVI